MDVPPPRKPLVLFDGDDTLWSTMPLYDRVKRLFAANVVHLVASSDEAIDFLDRSDQTNVETMGFSPNRFPLSVVQSYGALCRHHGATIDKEVERKLHQSAEAIFQTPAVTMSGAAPALQRLSPHCHLVLVTKGDQIVQASRLAASGLGSYFVSTLVVSDKTEGQFNAVLDDFQCSPNNAWSVGNSIRSDINPALRIGMAAVWIPFATWRHEEEPLLSHPRLFECQSLASAADVILREIA